MSSLILYSLIGGGIGALVGYVGKCTSGTCPLTSTWWRGAIYGAVLGAVFYLLSDQPKPGAMDRSTENVQLIGTDQFEAEVVHAGGPVVVDFYATWCGPCKRLSPMLDDLAGSFTNRIKFFKVNIDQSQAIARRFQIEAVPTLVFFHQGKPVDRIVGLPSANELKARMEGFAGRIDANQLDTRD